MALAKGTRMTIVRYSLCAAETLEILNRSELRDRLIDPPRPPFVMICAVSQKKHLAIKSHISYSRDDYTCMYEEEPVRVNRTDAEHCIRICEALRGLGFTKEEIERGVVRYDKIKEYGMAGYDLIQTKLDEFAKTRLFALCLHVAQKMEKEEAVCYLGLTQRIALPLERPCSSTPSIGPETADAARAGTRCGDRSSDSSDAPPSEQMTFPTF
jgi:hypothetical protein